MAQVSFSPEDRIAGGRQDPVAARITEIIAPVLESLGFEVVRVLLMSGDRPVLQIMADRKDGGQTSIDDCAGISRQVSAMLDVEDPISGAYELEVSSPGIDRPLVKLGDFDRWAGFDARLELVMPRQGRRRFKGRLIGTEDGHIKLDVDGDILAVAPADVMKAKLVLTDALLAASGPATG